MAQLVDGQWSTENLLFNHDETGLYFKRPSIFRDRISGDPGAEFPAEPGRYHLYCAVACPWAHRATLMRTLKKLEAIRDADQHLSGARRPGLVVRRSRPHRARDRPARALAA